MSEHTGKRSEAEQRINKPHECGLVGIDQLSVETKAQVDRIFAGSEFDGFTPTLISLSKDQMDHMALELADYRLKATSKSPMLEYQIGVDATATSHGVLSVSMDSQTEPGKKMVTDILIHDGLDQEKASNYPSLLSEAASGVKAQVA